jgi:hypothetical protein
MDKDMSEMLSEMRIMDHIDITKHFEPRAPSLAKAGQAGRQEQRKQTGAEQEQRKRTMKKKYLMDIRTAQSKR